MHTDGNHFDAIVKGLRTKSDKIRALAREGAATADIARYLGIRYQHARNVLVSSGLHNRRSSRTSGQAAGTSAMSGEPVAWVALDSLGRLQIPAALLEAAHIAGDEPVYVSARGDGIEILSRRGALRRAHDIARQFVPDGKSLVDELVVERRREAGLENG